jgi:hypothetical protein
MKDLTDYEKDIITVQSKRLEQELWHAASNNEYAYKEEITFSKLMDTHPRLMIIGLTPMALIILSIVVGITQ